MTTDLAKSEPQPLRVKERGLQLTTMEEMWRFANAVAKSGLAPKDVQTPEACLVAIQYGAELGLGPMASLQRIAPINGRPMIFGDGLLAVCMRSPSFDHAAFAETIQGDGESMAAFCSVGRVGGHDVVTRSFSVKDAKQARLWGKEGPWTFYPKRMLQMRARAFALRDCFADVLAGIDVAEEYGYTDRPEGTPAPRPVRQLEDKPAASVLDKIHAATRKPEPVEAVIPDDEIHSMSDLAADAEARELDKPPAPADVNRVKMALLGLKPAQSKAIRKQFSIGNVAELSSWTATDLSDLEIAIRDAKDGNA